MKALITLLLVSMLIGCGFSTKFQAGRIGVGVDSSIHATQE